MMNMALGTFYAMSVFMLPLEKEFGWTRAQTSWATTIGLGLLTLMQHPDQLAGVRTHAGTATVPRKDHHPGPRTKVPSQTETDQARLIASRLAAAGKPVSRRALRSGGIRGSNAALNALAREINAELAGISRAAPGLDGAAA